MLKSGFHNIVDIYFLNDGAESRTTQNNKYLSETPDLEGVPCRINKDSKVLFSADIKLMPGWVLKEVNTQVTYEVKKGKTVNGLTKSHHTSYEIEIKAESERIAGQYTNRS